MKSLSTYINECSVFTIIKPGFLDKTSDIIEIFDKAGWWPSQITIKTLTLQEAKELYKVHKNEEWYDSLCEYMSSGPSRAIMFSRDGQMNKSAFKDVADIKEDIRKKWGIDDCRNVMHSSDSYSAMEHEKSIYF